MDDKNKTIAIGKDKDPYEVPLNLLQLSTYLEYFGPNGNRDLKHIFGLLDLDSRTQKKYGNTIEFKTGVKERSNLRNINKALTMEIFTSGMFGYMDHPAEVHANCMVSRYPAKDAIDDKHSVVIPCNFAQGNVPDAQVDYEDFMVILEVSAKAQPSLQDYKKQFYGALKHARSTREKEYDKPIYCLLINERSLEEVVNKEAMEEVLKDIRPSEQIYITAMSIEEFAELGQKMADTYEDDISKIYTEDLHEVLKATVEKGVNGKFHEILAERLNAIKYPLRGIGF